MSERLQKVLANAGYGSRREIETWIANGRLSINGKAAALGAKVDSHDRIALDGKNLRVSNVSARTRVLALNKPEGVICSAKDPGKRRTAVSLLPSKDGERWLSVGRLDINTSGLLLFTNNGDLANRLMHPRFGLDREYAVRVYGTVNGDTLEQLRNGVDIDGELMGFDDIVKGNGRGTNNWYYCVVRQGRNREVRRIWESQGLKVSRLIRARFGNVMLPRDLKTGNYFEVKGMMLDDLYKLAKFQAPKRENTRRQTAQD